MNQDINENSVILVQSQSREVGNEVIHTLEPTKILSPVKDADASIKSTPRSGDFELRGSGDDSGNFSEIVDTTMSSTTSSPTTGVKKKSVEVEVEDPEKLIHNFLCGSVTMIKEKVQEEKADTDSNSNQCCEEVTSCDEERSDNYECQPDASSHSSRGSSPRNKPNSDFLNTLIANFNQLYEGRLAKLDTSTAGLSEIEVLLQKNAICQDWVKDLNEQNALLIQTVEEMEKETEQKIETLQRKMQKSTTLTESHMLMITEYEKQVQEFLSQRAQDERTSAELRLQARKIEAQHRKLQERLHATESEVESLVTLVTRVRDIGIWDVNGLHFEPRTKHRLFGLYPNLPGSEVQTVFTKEKAMKARDAQKELQDLTTKFEELIQYKTQFEENVVEKEKNVKQLEQENEQLRNLISDLEVQRADTKTALDKANTKLMEATMRLDIGLERSSAQEDELKELRIKLSTAYIERKNALEETSLLKNEMSQRMDEIQHMKNLLRTIQAETESTRSQVRDVQEKQISQLKEEVQLYQTKYEDAKKSLQYKSELIENLQVQMEQLHKKLQKAEGPMNHWMSGKGMVESDTDSELKMNINGKSNGEYQCNEDRKTNTEWNNNEKADHFQMTTNGSPTKSKMTNGDSISVQAYQELQNQLSALESHMLSKDTVISSLQCEVEVEKLAKAGLMSSMESKDVEITMQKVTIKHLQDALVNLKKSTGISQPPPTATQGSVPSSGKVFDI